MIRIAIVDDDGLRCEGLRAILSRFPDLRVVGCTECATVGAFVAAHHPEILLADSHMGGILDVCARMRHLGRPRPILVSVDGDDGWAAHALESGARGLLSRSADAKTLARAIRAVHAGQIWAPQMVINQVVDHAASGRERLEAHHRLAVETLSAREQDVLRCAAQGLSNKEIAARLGIRPATVKAHLTRIFQKLGLRDRVQLAVRFGSQAP